jgi:hypothetical protein
LVDTIKTISHENWVDNGIRDAADGGTQHREIQDENNTMTKAFSKLAEGFVEEKDLRSMLIGNIIGDEGSSLRWVAGFSSIHDRLSSWR